MTGALSHPQDKVIQLDDAIRMACDSIAPTWPLDRMIAVNPYWSWVDKPFSEVAHQLASLAGSPMSMPLAYYRQAWESGVISPEDLSMANSEAAAPKGWSPSSALLATKTEASPFVPPPLLSDTLDSHRDLQHEPAWCDTITHQIAQFCAAYFDESQADWHPNSDTGLYQSWRETLCYDHSVSLLMKAPKIPALAARLATSPRDQIEQALSDLNISPEYWHDYLQAVMYRVSGWAAWCAYQKWQATLSDQQQDSLIDLLAIRLSWECLVDDKTRLSGSVWQRWQQQWHEHFQLYPKAHTDARLIWQRAHEISYQRALTQRLSTSATRRGNDVEVQAVFCIDVRSEVIRRHLEAQSDKIQTLGFAGFFGLPVSYNPVGTDINRPQLPGLLAPAMSVCDSTGCHEKDTRIATARKRSLRNTAGWSMFNAMPASSFTLVEALGLSYVGKLIKNTLSLSPHSPSSPGLSKAQAGHLRPSLMADTAQQVELAESILKGMGLTDTLAPTVLLVGHGSENANNPQRAGLDCGACCGQTGEVNARALAQILNNDAVRKGLAQRGINIPASTQFIAALHNTTTDALTLFDTQTLAYAAKQTLQTLQKTLDAASAAAREERAPQLGLSTSGKRKNALEKAIKRRSRDWAQTRPEWGLANNAAFIIASREKTRGIRLSGRTFLHEYSSDADPDASLLAQIMTAPMVVTNWINMQYFGSTVDNRRFGSGNKTLHNVVGGRLGVFEGNGGDLRIGLALQSLHDGEAWRHDPLRLTVVIDAPEYAIESVINTHPIVQQLVENQWLYLARFDGSEITFRQGLGKDAEWRAPFSH